MPLELNIADGLAHLKLYQEQKPPAAIAHHAEDVDLEDLLEDIPKMLGSVVRNNAAQ